VRLFLLAFALSLAARAAEPPAIAVAEFNTNFGVVALF
jgi:hypothetical protein